jgi:hypothetical protein
MCASEQFHRRFSSIDYDAKGDFCREGFRGEISETLTAPTLRFGGVVNSRARLIVRLA